MNLIKVLLSFNFALFFGPIFSMEQRQISEENEQVEEAAEILLFLRENSLKKTEKNICVLCRKKFIKKSNLNRHFSATHLNIKRFECEKCEYKFSEKHHLDSHFISLHTNLKPFKCDICSQEFKSKSSLIRHNKIHKNKN